MDTSALSAEFCNESPDAIAYPAVAHQRHHLCVFVTFGPTVPATKVRTRQISMPDCGLCALFGRGSAAMSLSGGQSFALEVVPPGCSEGRDEFAKHVPYLQGSWTRLCVDLRMPCHFSNPPCDLIGFFKELAPNEHRLDATQVTKLGVF
jgi:hypothetical protein